MVGKSNRDYNQYEENEKSIVCWFDSSSSSIQSNLKI